MGIMTKRGAMEWGYAPSPVQEILFEGKSFFLKRDDFLHPDFSGNKARKFHYFLQRDFPEIRRLVSYGSAQSNAMLSLSVLARMRGWDFVYYIDHLPKYLREHPIGNYRTALDNGMELRINSVPSEERRREDTLFVEEGGRQAEAQEGVRVLAREVFQWYKQQKLEGLTLFLPSGTGTTALYLSKAFMLLDAPIGVVTTPCVGDAAYLRRQFAMLESEERFWPRIMDLPRKYHFGKLYPEFYEIWLKLKAQSGVEFDLLYDPKGWLTLLEYAERMEGPILYLHQGGLQGNESMLPRYRRKFPKMNEEKGRE